MKNKNRNKYALLLIAAASLAFSSPSFGMDVSQENVLTHDEMQKQVEILFKAVKEGNIEEIKKLLEGKSDSQKRELVNTASDDYNMTPLHFAASNGHTEVIKLLIKLGANIEAKNNPIMTPLHLAAKYGKTEAAGLLIKYSANIEARDNDNWTPLHWAAKCGHTKIIELLIENGADIEAKNKGKKTPLHLAAYNGHTDVAKLLIKLGAIIEAKDRFDNTPLHYAAEYGKIDVVRLLIESSANIEAKNNNNNTPRDFAVNKPAILRWLDLAENYKKASNKLEFIKKSQEKDLQDFEFLIKLAFNSSIKENKTQIKDTVFGQLYDKEKGLGQEQLVNILKIELPKYETIDIFKFIEIVAQKNHFFLPKDFMNKNAMPERIRIKTLFKEKEEKKETGKIWDNNVCFENNNKIEFLI